jgi:hypothetical protein
VSEVRPNLERVTDAQLNRRLARQLVERMQERDETL